MYKTQSLSKLGKWTVPKGGHEIITVLLIRMGNGWRAIEGNRTATGRKKSAAHILLEFSRPEGLLRCFSTRVGSYPGSPGMCSSQTRQLGRRSSSSQNNSRRRCWPRTLKTQLHLKRSSSIASSWHPSAFSFCSSLSKPQDNSFFRSTWPVKV